MVTSQCFVLFLGLYCISDGVTLGVNLRKGTLEVCMFSSNLIYSIGVFVSGWANFDFLASYFSASAIQ